MLGLVLMLSVLVVIVVMTVNTPDNHPDLGWLGLSMIAAGFASIWGTLALCIKRLHDLGWSVGVIVFLFVPMVSMVFLLILAIMPGLQETNQHGPPPFLDKS